MSSKDLNLFKGLYTGCAISPSYLITVEYPRRTKQVHLPATSARDQQMRISSRPRLVLLQKKDCLTCFIKKLYILPCTGMNAAQQIKGYFPSFIMGISSPPFRSFLTRILISD